MDNGQVLKAVANAVLALYGKPEPRDDTPVEDVVSLLNVLAAEKRAETH